MIRLRRYTDETKNGGMSNRCFENREYQATQRHPWGKNGSGQIFPVP